MSGPRYRRYKGTCKDRWYEADAADERARSAGTFLFAADDDINYTEILDYTCRSVVRDSSTARKKKTARGLAVLEEENGAGRRRVFLPLRRRAALLSRDPLDREFKLTDRFPFCLAFSSSLSLSLSSDARIFLGSPQRRFSRFHVKSAASPYRYELCRWHARISTSRFSLAERSLNQCSSEPTACVRGACRFGVNQRVLPRYHVSGAPRTNTAAVRASERLGDLRYFSRRCCRSDGVRILLIRGRYINSLSVCLSLLSL